MHQQTPLKDFEAKLGDFIIRLNLMSEQESDISHYNEGLSIYAANYVEKYCFEEFYNNENIPKEAITIFFDLQTFFDYIVENHTDPNKVSFNDHGIVVSNIIRARGVERRQEVILEMSKKPLEEPPKHQLEDNPEMLSGLKAENHYLKQAIHSLQSQFQLLTNRNQELQNKLKKLQQQWVKDNEASHTQIIQQQKNTLILSQNQQSFKQFASTTKVELQYIINVITQLKREISEEREQKDELKQQIRELRKIMKQGKSSVNKDVLGQKIELTIDKSNPYLAKYITSEGCIQKVDGDQTRYQILGNQVLGKVNRSYFQVRIINLMSNGLIIGLVSDIRKGQRHSYDQKQCICYDGTGKMFELGKKWPVPVKFQAGQVVRVMVDMQQSIVRWFINYSQVGSALIPDTLRNCRLVPYIQLNQVKDKIALNK